MKDYQSEFTEEELAIISKEFQRVGKNTYLDHAGTTLYSETQIDEVGKVLKENLFCNPHTCKITGDLVDQVRFRILKHFNTDSSEYGLVFTANATAALKLVAEGFQFNNFNQYGSFYYCQENHTSVLGMREIVTTENLYVLTKNEILKNLKSCKQLETNESTQNSVNSLVTFSAQCNFSGYKMPLELIETIQTNGLVETGKQIRASHTKISHDHNVKKENFYICLDTASYVASNYLDLQKYKPDFCCISFYKMFGYPTGVGALLVSKRGQSVLKKHYYGGGTVKIAMTREDFHEKRDGLSERFEDGTLPFLSVVALLQGFRLIERLIPPTSKSNSMERIAEHVFKLAKYCHLSLNALKHANGSPLIKFYNHNNYDDVKQQGGMVTFNILNPDGSYIGFAEVACMAAVHDIQLRTGCFCNPGACQHFLELSNDEIRKQFAAGHVCSDYNDLVDGQPTGAVRMSFGYMTRIEDVQKAIQMIKDCYLSSSTERLKLFEQAQLPKALQHIPGRLKPHLRKICVYPIKSCAAFEVNEWEVDESGLVYDRNWMIIDSSGMAITQKNNQQLCLIRPLIETDKNLLTLTFPNMKPFSIGLELPSTDNQIVETSFCQSKVCYDNVEGFDCGDEIASWLENCLQIAGVRMIRQNVERQRKSGLNSFANQAQFLLINRASVQWLSTKIEGDKEPLDHFVQRFRANFIIETPTAWEENQFESITIGAMQFKVDGFCTRCQMICINQQTGEKTTEPLRSIAREFQGKIRFGLYLSFKNRDALQQRTVISSNDSINITNLV